MPRQNRFIERQRKLSRFQVLKSIFSSLLITITAVVIAVSVIPSSPKGNLENLHVFSNQISYTVNIVDEDNAIIPNTLQVTLENQFEKYVNIIKVGKNTGVFNELKDNTNYTIKVLADKGFGLEVLDKEKVITKSVSGGAFTSIDLISEETDYQLNYEVSYFVNDLNSEYKSIQLRYGIKYSYEDDISNFQVIYLNKNTGTINLTNIFNENAEIYLYLEAIDFSDRVIILDSLEFNTPFNLYTSYSIDQVTDNSISISLWSEYIEGTELKYKVVLKRGFTIQDTKIVKYTPPDDSAQFQESEGKIVTFDKLRQNVDYTIEVYQMYRNPITLVEEEKLAGEQLITTLFQDNLNINVEELNDHYLVTITLDENPNNFDIGYYIIREDLAWYDFSSYSYQFINNQYIFTFEIQKPLIENYTIEIGIKDSNSYYKYKVLKNIEINQGE